MDDPRSETEAAGAARTGGVTAPEPPGPEDYPGYFARRSAEELEKAASAPTDFLRDQHLELSRVFARLAKKFGGGEAD